MEVNNTSLSPGGFRQDTEDNVRKMLTCCKKYGVMVVLGTDSHVDVTIGEYEYARKALEETDFPKELIANTSVEKLLSCLKRSRRAC